MDDNWLKQTEKPLFPDVIWQKPEQKSRSKKLLIIGGHINGFDELARAYQASVDAGVGEVKVVLPDKLKATVGGLVPDAVFCNSTGVGSIAESAIGQLRSFCEWADGILILQIGNNSETVLTMNKLLGDYSGSLIVFSELLEIVKHDPSLLRERPQTLLILSVSSLQQWLAFNMSDLAIKHDMGERPLAQALSLYKSTQPIISILGKNVFTAYQDKVVSTERPANIDLIALAAWCGVWWIQQPETPLETISSAIYEF